MSRPISAYATEKRFRPKRAPERASYDKALVHAILDEALMAHVAYGDEAGCPHVLPMYFVRDGESLLLHGSAKMGQAKAARRGAPFCVNVTLLDGLVLARSGFHHSVNYRSVTVHGVPEILEGAEKARALDLTVERLAKGRAAEVRAANAKEFKATVVLRLKLQQVAAKTRTGGVNDEPEDMDLPVWAGVIPLHLAVGAPIADEQCAPGAAAPSLALPGSQSER
ncbi:pyridoxamine 5'-phosphate oxidase family protein [Tepidicaulis sp.]|uniref:pyridoxamine 5'-phosphate oxidase family protein n=1 Tax=Tepidicaulis sp. TaxID=1920809 RepID=UPI003B5CB434